MSQQPGHWRTSVAIRTDGKGASSRRGRHTSQMTHRTETSAPVTQGRDQPTSTSACLVPYLMLLIKFYWKRLVTITLLFHGNLWKWMPQLPPPPHGRHRPTEFRGLRPPTSSFRSSDSRALRSSSFRMIALSSAILSWKRRASFSSNCCS